MHTVNSRVAPTSRLAGPLRSQDKPWIGRGDPSADGLRVFVGRPDASGRHPRLNMLEKSGRTTQPRPRVMGCRTRLRGHRNQLGRKVHNAHPNRDKNAVQGE